MIFQKRDLELQLKLLGKLRKGKPIVKINLIVHTVENLTTLVIWVQSD